jgi:hypothetical protein
MPSYLFLPDEMGLTCAISEVKPTGKHFTLPELQAHVLGYIEALYPIDEKRSYSIPLSEEYHLTLWADRYAFFGNEEARLLDKPHMFPNVPISYLLGHVIVGPVIAVGNEHDPENRDDT